MIQIKGKKIRLTKIGRSADPYHKDFEYLRSGDVRQGNAMCDIEEGQSLYIQTGNAEIFRTSMIVKILDDNKFETLNSIYEYELLEEDNGLSGGLGKGESKGPDVPEGPRGRAEDSPGIDGRGRGGRFAAIMHW